jgi:hypothetical protein
MCKNENLKLDQEIMIHDHPMKCYICNREYIHTGLFVYFGHAMWQGKVVDVFNAIEQPCKCPDCYSEDWCYLEECQDQESPKPITCKIPAFESGLLGDKRYDLDPCHFCHSTKVALLHIDVDVEVEVEYHNNYFVKCLQCKARGPESDIEEKAALLWNVKSGELHEKVK